MAEESKKREREEEVEMEKERQKRKCMEEGQSYWDQNHYSKRALQALIQDRLDDSPGNGDTTALPPTWHGKFFSLFMFKQPSIVALNCKAILSFIL